MSRTAALAFIVALLAVLPAMGAPTSSVPKATPVTAFDEGKAFFKQGRYKDAAECLEKAVRETPDFVDAWVYLGLANQQLRQWDRAERALLKASELNSREYRAWAALADVAASQGQYTKARAYARKILDFDPRSFFAYYLLGVIDYYEGKLAEAAANFDRSRSLWNEFAPTWANLAVCSYDQHNVQSAAAQIHKATQLDPRAVQYLFLHGWFATMANDTGTSMLSFRRLLDADKEESKYSDTVRAFIAMRNGSAAQARGYIDEALKKDPEFVQALVLKSLLLIRDGKRDEAVKTLQEALEIDSLDYDARDTLRHLGVTPPPPHPRRLPGQKEAAPASSPSPAASPATPSDLHPSPAPTAPPPPPGVPH